MDRDRELTHSQRKAAIALMLADGYVLTTSYIAQRFGITPQGAWGILDSLCGLDSLALTRDGDLWYSLNPRRKLHRCVCRSSVR